MSIVLPDILYRTKRGLCPGCGAPLKLDRDDAATVCGFCGQSAVLERRLRKIEPEVDGAPLRLYFDDQSANTGQATSARWVRSRQYREGLVGSANCPGCGDELHYEADASVITCRTCGTDSRLERRLWSPAPDPDTEIARPQHPSQRDSDGHHPETEHLIWRILNEPDADHRLRLAMRLDEWIHVNATAARLLPPLLGSTQHAEPALQWQCAQLICKLLCEGDASLRNTAVRAGERFLFDTACPRAIVFELGMGDGVCLKPLLDAAEWAVRAGDFEYACACLVGVNWIFQRNFQHHEIMGQIILYRMLYLTGPVLAFALLLAQRQVTGTGFHYKPEALLAFIDDAAVERPVLVPELDKSFYCGWPKDTGDMQYRMSVYAGLKTDAARASALRHFIRVPDGCTDGDYQAFFAFVLPLLKHGSETVRKGAEHALYEVFHHAGTNTPAMDGLVAEHQRNLPVEVQRAYLRLNPKTPYLSYEGLPYWQSPPAETLSPELAKAKDEWTQGLHRAVDAHNAISHQAADRRQVVQDLDVPIFDGITDGDEPQDEEDRRVYERPSPEERPAPGDETAPPQELLDEAAAMQIASYRQVIAQLEAMRPQMQAIGAHAVEAIDQQIAQIRQMCPGV